MNAEFAYPQALRTLIDRLPMRRAGLRVGAYSCIDIVGLRFPLDAAITVARAMPPVPC